MTRRGRLEAVVIAGLLFGVAAMCQPLSIALFRLVFFVTLGVIVAFIVVSHLPEGRRRP